MALLLGIDLGTSCFKVGLFDEIGTMRGLGRVAVGKSSPAPGRSELPVAEFWRLLRQGLAEALAQAKARSGDIVGLSYSSQANSFLLLDDRNEPITPLVIWSDQRAHPVEQAVVDFGRSEPFRRLMERISATHRVLLHRVQEAPPLRRIIAAGMHSSLRADLRGMVHPDRHYEPQPAVVATYRQAGPAT